jgi:alkanesulfonate monooxygenase SsuD/methylene tetrahydromethanopterin reductase-like flavin-dependent oxidoreductase (luciferase family)
MTNAATDRSATRYGVLVRHFGPHASRDAVVADAARLEDLGFDSLWARDHVVYEPHGFESQNPTFLDPLITLAAAAAATDRMTLATGCLIPHRNPVAAALALASLDFIAGGGRVLVGFGLGSFDHEFESVGMGGWDRREVFEEQVLVMRRLWGEVDPVNHDGQFYRFDKVSIRPQPDGGTLPIWYSGSSRAAVRRAVANCDGWVPGALPRGLMVERIELMSDLVGKADRELLTIGCMPIVSLAPTVEKAVASIGLDRLIDQANQRYRPTDPYRSLEDLDGSVIAGPPDRIVEEVLRFHEVGVSHIVFDLRLRFDDWEQHTELLAAKVLPALRREAPVVGPR